MQEPAHFKGKDAIGHVAEAQAQGIISAAEIHGTEIPGHLSAGADSARETSLVLASLWIILTYFHVPVLAPLLIFAGSWLIWKTGRSAWLGWSRIERLHRVVEQEKWEIEHHRQQERDELGVLYAAKGFEGKLLEDVLDVLMADGDRLLRVMVEEELGLSLESHEHPLKQAVGAAVGVLFASIFCFFGLFLYPPLGLVIAAFAALSAAAALAAWQERNRIVPAIVWNLGLGILSLSFLYFFLNASVVSGIKI
ncbi:MAG: VIT1/CCC1 transporter family protein [Parachlamydia sp.]|nr:VIT1/CCC1 transporter family protein [Parachlamydia sp.]